MRVRLTVTWCQFRAGEAVPVSGWGGGDLCGLRALRAVSPSSGAAQMRHGPRRGGVRARKGPESGPSEARTVASLDRCRIKVALDDPIDARIAAIAERQRARFSRGQLLAAGVGEGAIKRRLRKGRLVAVHCG